jgi:hypothetical protein
LGKPVKRDIQEWAELRLPLCGLNVKPESVVQESVGVVMVVVVKVPVDILPCGEGQIAVERGKTQGDGQC